MNYKLTFFLVLFLCSKGFGQKDMEASQQLEREINTLFTSVDGDFAMAFTSLTNHKHQILINEKEEFHAASTMKTPVMIALFKQAEERRISLSDSLLVKNEFTSIADGSLFSLDIGRDDGEHIYEQIGKSRSIRELLVDMIIYSSNLATNILIELAGTENISATMEELGAKDIKVLRGVEDMKAYEAGLNNTTTAYDLMLIFEKLGRGEAVNPKASEEMLAILMRQTHRNIIPAKLPKDVKVANKTGFITGVRHDSGIVYLADGRKYVLVLLSKNMKDEAEGTEMLAEVSRLVYESELF